MKVGDKVKVRDVLQTVKDFRGRPGIILAQFHDFKLVDVCFDGGFDNVWFHESELEVIEHA